MNLLPHHLEELYQLGQFTNQCLSPQQNRVLQIKATQGLPHKQVAQLIRRDVKTVEKVVAIITKKYRNFYGSPEQNASFQRIQSRAAYYYFLKDLLERS